MYVAIFFDILAGGTTENEFLESLYANTTEKTNWTVSEIPLKELIEDLKKTEIYHYKGSLTSPTCTETV
jgi:carbonic anhydrase